MAVEEKKRKIAETQNTKMFRSRFDIFVLNALANNHNGESYGYDVINYIQSRTQGHYSVRTNSTVYNTLKRLEDQGYVSAIDKDAESNGAARVYYTLTDEGNAYLDRHKREYKYLRTLLDNLLTDEKFDLENEEIPYDASNLKPLTRRARNQASDDVASDSIAEAECGAEEKSGLGGAIAEGDGREADMKAEAAEIEGNGARMADMRSTPEDVASEPGRGARTSESAAGERGPEANESSAESSPTESLGVAERESREATRFEIERNANDRAYASAFASIARRVIASGAKNDKQIAGGDKRSIAPEPASSGSALIEFERRLRKDGFSLMRREDPTDESGRKIGYIYLYRIMRDATALCGALFVAALFVAFFVKAFEFGALPFALLVVVAIGFIAVSFALCATNGNKLFRDNVNEAMVCLVPTGAYALIAFLTVIFALLIPGGDGLAAASTYLPMLLLSIMPISGFVFALLHRSGRYFSKG